MFDIEKKITKISAEEYSAEPFSFRGILVALSHVYGLLGSFRLWLYKKHILKTRQPPCFVISVGNIVAGGSGKTPMTVYLAEMLRDNGYHPVVVSRGYGGAFEKGHDPVVAGDGQNLFFTPDEVGDEPFMMAARRSFPVVVAKDRFRGALKAVDLLNLLSGKMGLDNKQEDCNSSAPFPCCKGAEKEGRGKKEEENKSRYVLILDDGFQHIRLKRDLDIVLLDCNRPLGNGRLLPAGRLRERGSGLKRADLIVLTRCPEADCLDDTTHSAQFLDKKWGLQTAVESGKPLDDKKFMTFHRPSLHLFIEGENRARCKGDTFLSNKEKSTLFTLKFLSSRNALLFSGIADNSSFRKTVENLGICVREHLEFNDHYMYKSGDIFQIIELYNSCGANLLITTEKDYARLNFRKTWPMDLAVIAVDIAFFDPLEKKRFNSLVLRRIQSNR